MESQIEAMTIQNELVIKQHLEIVSNLKSMSNLQNEIAQQVINQHEETETLYKMLGLKKDLSYYSFNLMNEEEH